MFTLFRMRAGKVIAGPIAHLLHSIDHHRHQPSSTRHCPVCRKFHVAASMLLQVPWTMSNILSRRSPLQTTKRPARNWVLVNACFATPKSPPTCKSNVHTCNKTKYKTQRIFLLRRSQSQLYDHPKIRIHWQCWSTGGLIDATIPSL
jgi:hypothetical protein